MASDESGRHDETSPAILDGDLPAGEDSSPATAGGFWSRVIFLAVISGVVVLAHYLTPAEMHHSILHDIYRRILYVPVILAAFWFGWRGGLLCAALIAVAYLPHIYRDWGGDFFSLNLNRTLEVIMYLVVGGITGLLSDRLRGANRRLLAQSARLRQAMDALKEKTREVFMAEQQLRQADRLTAIGQLTAGLAHEIRNPLGSIRGTAEILGDPDIEPERRAEFCRIMIEETERLDHVLGNFLDYAKSQKGEGSKASADLAVVVARLLTLLGMKMQSQGIELDNRIPEGLPHLRIGEALLQQVMLNIILNAVQAMADGGRLELSARHMADQGRVIIEVGDTGPGIDPRIRARIFDPFFTTKNTGTGLGLSIVQKIVWSHDGRVWLDDAREAGTRVWIEFPCE